MRTFPDNRQVRLDVYAWDDDDTVYDTEAQKEDTKNLPKRSRFYQAVLDSNLLPPGSVDFNKLNRAFIILIMPFDPFGKGFYKYTFRMKCEECPNLELQDDATRIFLNAMARILKVSPELIELLLTWKNQRMRSRVRAQARRLNCSIRKSVRSGRTRKWRRNSCAHGKKEK